MNKFKYFFAEVFKRHTEDDAEKVVIVGAPGTIPDPFTLTSACPQPWLYTRVLAFFLLATGLLFLANTMTNIGQFVNVMFLGAFAVPFTTLVLFFEFNVFRNISLYTVFKALFIGGALALITTAVLPSFWFQGFSGTADAFLAGIGEEIAKLIIVYWILKRNRAYPYILNGLLIGAAVGAGFAIFETAGYAMNRFLSGKGGWIGHDSIMVLSIRNLLAPGGHVVWAAMSGAGLQLAVRREPYRRKSHRWRLDAGLLPTMCRESLSPAVFGRRVFWETFLVPVSLHVLWDLPGPESEWGAIASYLYLVLVAWLSVARLLRRGLREVDEMRATVPWHGSGMAVSGVPANSFRRFLARMIDFQFECFLVWGAMSRTAGYFSLEESIRNWPNALFIVAVIPFSLMFEAIVYEIIGTTAGKWLFSLRVLNVSGRDLSSRAYAKRLVRLWWSGLGLGVLFVMPFTIFRQDRRIEKGLPASYDEHAGISVVRERIRFLRWLVAAPFLAFSALMVAICVFPETSDDPVVSPTEKVSPSPIIDSRIVSLVSESGLCFKTTKWGAAVFLVSLEDGRTQGCFVLPKTVEEDCGSFVCVGSIIASPDMVRAKTLHEILRANISRRARVWCEMGGHLGLRVLLPIDIDPVDFRRVVLSLAEDADARELEITGEDAF